LDSCSAISADRCRRAIANRKRQVGYLAAHPASADPHSLIYLTLLSAIANAEQRVYLTNAYFVPDPQLIKFLIDAARQRVAGTNRGILVVAGSGGYVDG